MTIHLDLVLRELCWPVYPVCLSSGECSGLFGTRINRGCPHLLFSDESHWDKLSCVDHLDRLTEVSFGVPYDPGDSDSRRWSHLVLRVVDITSRWPPIPPSRPSYSEESEFLVTVYPYVWRQKRGTFSPPPIGNEKVGVFERVKKMSRSP